MEADRRFTPSASLSEASLNASKKVLDRFFEIFNGRYWLRGMVEVFLDGRPLDRGTVVNDGAVALLSVFFPHLPCVPSQGKWEKLYPALAFFVKTYVLGGILSKIMEGSFADADFVDPTSDEAVRDKSDANGSIDPALQESLMWRTTQGSRYKRAQKLVVDIWMNYVFLSLCVVM